MTFEQNIVMSTAAAAVRFLESVKARSSCARNVTGAVNALSRNTATSTEPELCPGMRCWNPGMKEKLTLV